MSKSNVYENDLLKLVFQAIPMAGLAIDHSSPVTSLSVALHTADPGETGDQSTSEIAYTGYARATVVRSAVGWTVTNNSVSPAANIDFPLMTGGGGGTVTHWSVGTGVGNKMLYSGAVSLSVIVAIGVIPRLTTACAITED